MGFLHGLIQVKARHARRWQQEGMHVAILSCLAMALLAAHALRGGDPGLAVVLLGCAGLAWGRRGWIRWVLVAVLAWGCVTWVRAGVDLYLMRVAMGGDGTRLAVIMTGVTLFTLVALAVTLLEPGRRRRRRAAAPEGEAAEAEAARDLDTALAALLTAALLAVARSMAPFPLLLADRFLSGWGWLQVAAMAAYAGWLAGAMREPAGHARWRPRVWALFSGVFFLQLLLGLAGETRLLMTGALHLPVPALILGGPLYRGEGLFMAILFLVTTLLAGSAWCSHLCYIGAWDDACSRRGRRGAQGRKGRRPSGERRAAARRLGRWVWLGRGATMLLTVCAALGLRAAGAPPGAALWPAAAFGLAGVGVMLLISRRMGSMAHCAAFCPMGLAATLLGRCTPWRMRLGEGCTGCGRCVPACRYGALDAARVAAPGGGGPGLSCTLCGDCVAACPHGAMGIRLGRAGPALSRRAFLLAIVPLHATFLAVARV